MRDSEFFKIDRLALAMAREGKEKSRALPARAYRNPEETYEFESERRRQQEERKAMRLKLKTGVQNDG